MRKKISGKCLRQEKGDMVVLFALSLVILLGFVSLAIDIGMVNVKRAAMMDLCQQMRKARLDAKEYIMNAKDPGLMIYEISNNCARENGFEGDLIVYYMEESDPAAPTSAWVDRRTYTVRVVLKQKYQFAFAAAFFAGPGSQEITVYLDGGEQKTSGKSEWAEKVPVWHPGSDLRTGSFSRMDPAGSGGYSYIAGDYPAGW